MDAGIANAMAHVWAAKLRIILCFVRYAVFAKSRYEKYYPKFGDPLNLAALCGSTPIAHAKGQCLIQTCSGGEVPPPQKKKKFRL